MTNKLKAIGISFLVTVSPAAVVFACCMFAGVIFNDVYNALFFPTSLLGILLLIPIGIVCAFALSGGVSCVSIVYSNLAIFKFGDNIYKIDANPNVSSSAKLGFIISIVMFLLMIPISVLIWIASSIVILFSQRRTKVVLENSKDSFKKLAIVLVGCIGALGLGCINFGLLALQDAKYSVDNFDFKYISFEYDMEDWGGNLLGQCSVYYFTYEFQNTGTVKGGLSGDIIIEIKNGEKIKIISDEGLTPYPSSEDDFEKHVRKTYLYVPVSNTQANNTLKNNLNDVKIYALVTYAGWEGGFIESRGRNYDNPIEIVIKDFGVGGKTQSPGQTGGENPGTGLTNEQKYQQAKGLYNQGKYQEAYDIFIQLGSYSDSSIWANNCEEKMAEQSRLESLNQFKQYLSYIDNNIPVPSMVEYWGTAGIGTTYYEGSYRNCVYGPGYIYNMANGLSFVSNYESELIAAGYAKVTGGSSYNDCDYYYKKGDVVVGFNNLINNYYDFYLYMVAFKV